MTDRMQASLERARDLVRGADDDDPRCRALFAELADSIEPAFVRMATLFSSGRPVDALESGVYVRVEDLEDEWERRLTSAIAPLRKAVRAAFRDRDRPAEERTADVERAAVQAANILATPLDLPTRRIRRPRGRRR